MVLQRCSKIAVLIVLISPLWRSTSVWAENGDTEPLAIGQEVAISRHLEDGMEFTLSLSEILEYGRKLFTAVWTNQEGGGRPQTKGVGSPLSDPFDPLIFPRNFNRISAPDANSCSGCHNLPFGVPGGGGDIVANVFVLGHRFDFATLGATDDLVETKGSLDEEGSPVTLQSIANSRNTLGMFGSGFIEMLARQITADLQAIREVTGPGETRPLISKGISFGRLTHNADGTWDTSLVEGLPSPSLASSGPGDPPNLIIRPFHQAGAAVSLRQFTNNAFNHHHGIQSSERFGADTDPDEDGFYEELTRADVTAVTLYQATLPIPGRVIPRNRVIEEAVLLGEELFSQIGCSGCHMPTLPLDAEGWIYTEPNPYNPPGNLQPGDAAPLDVDLTDHNLAGPRLQPDIHGVVQVPAFTDFKLHDLTYGPDDPNREPLDMNEEPGSAEFFAGNSRFLTRKLWGTANEPPYFHHGQFTTLRDAVLAHYGEASQSRENYEALTGSERDCVIEFLKTLQVLPPGTRHRTIDAAGRPRDWPPRWASSQGGH